MRIGENRINYENFRPRTEARVELAQTTPAEANSVGPREGFFAGRPNFYGPQTPTEPPPPPPPPPISDEQARSEADAIIQANGGRENLNIDGVAEALRTRAQQDPAAADDITRSVLGKIEEDDRDEVAQQFLDGFSDAELVELTRNPDGKNLANRMMQPLLSGDDVHDDERATANRVFRAFTGFADGPVLSAAPNYTFGPDDNPEVHPDITRDINSTNGQEAAAAVIEFSNNSDRVATQSNWVAQMLEQHKDDPTFLRDFFGTLGPERTAESLRHIASYGYGKQFGSEGQQQAIQNSADALSTMVREGVFSQSDMERLVGQMAGQSPGGNFYFSTEVLGKASPEVNQMFYEAAKNWALDHPGAREANVMMAHATQALSHTSYENQMQQLSALQKDGALGDVVRMAAQGEAEYGYPNNLEDFVANDHYYPFEQSKASPLTGLSALMTNAAFAGYDERGGANVSNLEAIQTEMFNAGAGVLQNSATAREHYRTNTNFKDGMSALFTENYDQIIESRVGENGFSLTSDGLKSLKAFFQETLFTPPLGYRATSTAQFIKNQVGQVMSDVDTLSDQQFMEKYGRDKVQMASLTGQQFGVMVSALKQSLSDIKGKSEAEVKGLVDVLNGLISVGAAAGGAGGPAAATGSAIVGEALKLALGQVGQDIAQGRLDEAVRQLKEQGIDVANFDGYAFNDVLVTVEHQGAHDSFRDAYDYTKNLTS